MTGSFWWDLLIGVAAVLTVVAVVLVFGFRWPMLRVLAVVAGPAGAGRGEAARLGRCVPRFPRPRRRSPDRPDHPATTSSPRASMALPVFFKALRSTPLPTDPSSVPVRRPLRFLPSRT